MTTAQPPQDQRPYSTVLPAAHPAGYVPAFEGADGNEDPAPEAVVHSTPPAPIGPDNADADGRFEVAEEVSFDQQSDAARRVGQLPLDFAGPDSVPTAVNPAEAVGRTLQGVAPGSAAVPAARAQDPGHQAAPGTAHSGEAICPECEGSGKTRAGLTCAQCGGRGTVTQLVGDA